MHACIPCFCPTGYHPHADGAPPGRSGCPQVEALRELLFRLCWVPTVGPSHPGPQVEALQDAFIALAEAVVVEMGERLGGPTAQSGICSVLGLCRSISRRRLISRLAVRARSDTAVDASFATFGNANLTCCFRALLPHACRGPQGRSQGLAGGWWAYVLRGVRQAQSLNP